MTGQLKCIADMWQGALKTEKLNIVLAFCPILCSPTTVQKYIIYR